MRLNQSLSILSRRRLIYGVRCQGDPKCDSVDWAPFSALLSESLPQLYSNFPFSMVTCPCSCLFLHCNKGWLHPPQFRANLPEEFSTNLEGSRHASSSKWKNMENIGKYILKLPKRHPLVQISHHKFFTRLSPAIPTVLLRVPAWN